MTSRTFGALESGASREKAASERQPYLDAIQCFLVFPLVTAGLYQFQSRSGGIEGFDKNFYAWAMHRCAWPTIPLTIDYHDKEWGVPVHDDRLLFEFLILEGAQAGLSWTTVLKKREAYRAAFDNFEPSIVARYTETRCKKLLQNEGIIRNRLKISSAVRNARAFLEVQKEFGTFDRYIWGFVGGKPKVNHWKESSEVPPKTAESDAMSKDLLKRDFKFVGSTICYAYMQATGMVNDHLVSCFRHAS